ncbi:acyl-CoA dehydrogenase family protein [Caballeronia sp. BR00000012568055]|uniref:acyl-CoA dehydrogenase family protein n=1 Tax=Caballeronia sp. BR00000012568055 TaxID=2918761 RepID=UPI0023F8B6FE|nr:acyl-CoA dehydrogenase family protein [Caballeronia sp. BR00000012568055]
MDFSLSPELKKLREQIREFVAQEIVPLESNPAAYDAHENIAVDQLTKLREKAKRAGLWSPQMPRERGGLGLKMHEMAACYEEMNWSIFGPVVFNCAAPDDGNMMILNKAATDAQKARWLQPIIEGKVRSSFAMTEPSPGSGSDPTMMKTSAKLVDGKWIVNGKKWFITGAEEAQHFILMARTSDDPRKGLTAFLFDREQPGWHIVRRIGIIGPEEHGGHCEIAFEGLSIDDSNRLGAVGDGLKITQMRLGPARLTHCMRWTGLAKRSLDIALQYVEKRDSGAGKLLDRESVQQMLGDAALQIDIGRLLTMRACWLLDQGSFARKEISMAKIVVADALQKAVDTAIQLCGAYGYSTDTPLGWIYRYARQARLVDGASEVHKMVLAQRLVDERQDFWSWE